MNEQVKAYIDMKFEEMKRSANFAMKFDVYNFEKHLQLLNGVDIGLGRDKGSRIGKAPDEKLGFYGAAPVVRPSSLTLPSGGVTQDAQSRNAISDINNRLQSLGLIT
jgi:hypothetical protein